MFGCLRRVGCLALLVIVAGAVYITRHRWMPLVLPGHGQDVASAAWKPISPDGAARARRALIRLNEPTGPVFANISADELASFILDSVAKTTETPRPVEAAVQGDRLLLRTTVRIADLGVENVPFLGGADKTATVLIAGTLSVERPGLGEWRVKSVRVNEIDLPGPILTRVTRALARQMQRAGTRDDSFGFALPPQVADLRVDNGKITLYKAAK